jgi:phage portal protein BeeE
MGKLGTWLRKHAVVELESRSTALSFVDWAKMFRPGAQVAYGGSTHQAFSAQSMSSGAGWYDTNSVVFACEAKRLLIFSEARFQFQQVRNGKLGDLFGTQALSVLEEPWPGATTRDLLIQAELDVALAGNSYWVRDPERPSYLLRLDPSCVSILTERSRDDVWGYPLGERLLAYVHRVDRDQVVFYEPTEIAHYKPIPDRMNRFIGMSWLNPCLPDIESDVAMTEHKRVQLTSGASIPFVVTLSDPVAPEEFTEFVSNFRRFHDGPENAGKTLFLNAGADVKTVGQTFENLEMRATQGAGETRIAACSGVAPIVVGLSEGLNAATYSNYGQARRSTADTLFHPLWGAVAAAFEYVVDVPAGARLWYDFEHIAFTREDVKDQAEIRQIDGSTIRQLIDAGFEPASVVAAVIANDLSLLTHTNLFSVQLQPPGTQAALPVGSGNGS